MMRRAIRIALIVAMALVGTVAGSSSAADADDAFHCGTVGNVSIKYNANQRQDNLILRNQSLCVGTRPTSIRQVQEMYQNGGYGRIAVLDRTTQNSSITKNLWAQCADKRCYGSYTIIVETDFYWSGGIPAGVAIPGCVIAHPSTVTCRQSNGVVVEVSNTSDGRSIRVTE
jgi:hypothetical protein